MLLSIHVKNMALIREEEVSFGPGLNILTGETGAGKSILIGAVNVALGNGNFKDYVPEGAEYALVELVFETDRERVLEKMKELDIPEDDGLIVLSRSFRGGRSVNRINGETVSLAALREMAGELIDIHGQNANQELLRAKNHLHILDEFAGEAASSLLGEAAAAYAEMRSAARELEGALEAEKDRGRRADLLTYEIDEIEQAALTEGEDEELEKKFRLLSNGQKIMESLQAASRQISEDGGASEQIGHAARSLLEVSGLDERLDELAGELSEIESMMDDLGRGLAGYLDDFSYDEREFAQTGERLDLINRLKNKYGRTIGEILSYRDRQQEELEKLQNYEAYLEELREKLARAQKRYDEAADALTKLRTGSAPLLAERMRASLEDLNFPEVRFEVSISPLPEPSASGKDSVRFMISLNPGVPLRPLEEVASGGELSRIMLAIRAVMADQDQTDSLIFDEIDTGISGRTAQKVSEKMAVISASRQVICITHLAQIAAMADRHMAIEKAVGGGQTVTHIRPLSGEESLEELARILGGAQITEKVYENASEMKTMADNIKEECRKNRGRE